MGLYNFQSRFVPFILDGSKTHTIRALRKHPDKPGNTLHLYTGLRQRGPIIQKLASGDVVRQKMARLLMRAPCVKVEPILIYRASIVVAGQELSLQEKDLLAWRDGFRQPVSRFGGNTKRGLQGSFDLMLEFWVREHAAQNEPFNGHIIHWKGESA